MDSGKPELQLKNLYRGFHNYESTVKNSGLMRFLMLMKHICGLSVYV